MKTININKVIREISNSKFSTFTLTLEESSINYGLEIAMQIIKNNIKEKKNHDYIVYHKSDVVTMKNIQTGKTKIKDYTKQGKEMF